jgi:hypothetical protein
MCPKPPHFKSYRVGRLEAVLKKHSARRKQLTPALHSSAQLQQCNSIPVLQRRAEQLRLELLLHADAAAPRVQQLRKLDKLVGMQHPEGKQLSVACTVYCLGRNVDASCTT